MYPTYQASYYVGNCKYCGAAGYYNYEEDKVRFSKPELGCLCYIEEEDCSASKPNY